MDTGETMPAQKCFCNRSRHLAYIGHTTLLLLALAWSLTAAPRKQWEPDVKTGGEESVVWGVSAVCEHSQSWEKPSRKTRADKTPAVAPMTPQKDQKAQHHWPFHADVSQCDWTVRCSMEVASWLHLPRAARDQENQFLLKAWGPFSKTASIFASNHLTTAVEDNTLCLEREKLTLMEIG